MGQANLTNLSGHTSASIPAGLVNNLPEGIQVIGRHYADGDVIAACAAFERLKPWNDAYQICKAASCLIPAFDGAIFSLDWREALWARFYTGAPRRPRQSIGQYKIVKRA